MLWDYPRSGAELTIRDRDQNVTVSLTPEITMCQVFAPDCQVPATDVDAKLIPP